MIVNETTLDEKMSPFLVYRDELKAIDNLLDSVNKQVLSTIGVYSSGHKKSID